MGGCRVMGLVFIRTFCLRGAVAEVKGGLACIGNSLSSSSKSHGSLPQLRGGEQGSQKSMASSHVQRIRTSELLFLILCLQPVLLPTTWCSRCQGWLAVPWIGEWVACRSEKK